MEKIKTLYLFRGVSGAGKSTTAESLAGYNKVNSADDYFYEHGTNKNKYEFNSNLLHIAHKQCKNRVEFRMSVSDSSVFVANTFTTEKELKPYFDLANKYDYRVISLIVENRHGNSSIHNVPKETLDKMETRFNIKLR